MARILKRIGLAAVLVVMWATTVPAGKTLDMYVVDTEGGKALLLISPSGQTMLVDAGFPGNNDRDAIRIEEAARAAGVTRFDYLVVTHYDGDHVNNVPATVARIPAVTYVDHGKAVVDNPNTTKAVAAYDALWAGARHLVVRPGDRIPFAGVEVQVVTSGFDKIAKPLPGGGIPNPYCADTKPMTWPKVDEDVSENAASVGLLYTFGKFRMLDMADLTWNKEIALMCPANPVGTVDLFMVSHHGNNISNSPALVKAIRPRVTIMNNGARKVGAVEAIQTLKAAPGVEANYQLHWSMNAPNDNPPDEYIANLQDSPDGKWIKVSVEENGAFTVTNARTGVSKVFGR
jgi:competence protein ComEC